MRFFATPLDGGENEQDQIDLICNFIIVLSE